MLTDSFKQYESPEKLLSKIDQLGGAQKNLETNSEFLSRMSNFGNATVFSNVSDSEIKFNKETGAISFEKLMHDAQEFGYRAGENKMRDSKNAYLSLALSDVSFNKGSYVGQNAFGAETVVDVVQSEHIYLVSPPIPNVSARMVIATLVSDLDISAAELAEQRDNIRLAIMFEPANRFLQIDTHYGRATISNKRESTVNNYFLDMKLAGVGLVNVNSNKVYSKRFRVKFRSF